MENEESQLTDLASRPVSPAAWHEAAVYRSLYVGLPFDYG